ncbi:MAG: hypothetical protein WCA09_07550 [Burkholderiales bacterium]
MEPAPEVTEVDMDFDIRQSGSGRPSRRRSTHLFGEIGVLLLLMLAACDFDASNAVPSVAAAERERAPAAQELDARHLTARGIPDDFLFAPDFVWLHVDRTDIPWQTSRTEDPDGIRSF